MDEKAMLEKIVRLDVEARKQERIVKRLLRRKKAVNEGRHISAIITPFPISNAVIGNDVRGPVLRYMFPCAGVITKGLIELGIKPKNGVRMDVEFVSDLGGEKKSFVITRKNLLVEPNIPVDSGHRLTVSIEPIGDDQLKEVWGAFLWVPNTRDVDIKRFLSNEIEGTETFDDLEEE